MTEKQGIVNDGNQLSVKTELTGKCLRVFCDPLPDKKSRYRFFLEKDGSAMFSYRSVYGDNVAFWLKEAGQYTVRVELVRKEKLLSQAESETIAYEGCCGEAKATAAPYPNIFACIAQVAKEICGSFDSTLRLALYNYRLENKDSKLGKLWDIINPLIQIFTYWFVFGIGLRSGKPVDGHPYMIWMLCGIVPWFFMNSAITEGCSAVYSKANMVLRMKYPLTTLPLQYVLVPFFEHIITLGILFVVSICYGYLPNWHWLNLLYYQFYMLFFLYSLTLITSTLTMIARDWSKLIRSLMRMLFYLTPILWKLEDKTSIPETIRTILQYNPIYYVVYGYRCSILYQKDFWLWPRRLLFFWGFALVLFVIGAGLFGRYRDRFSDML